MLNGKQMYFLQGHAAWDFFLLLSTENGTWEVPYFCSAEGMRAKLYWRQAIQSYQWSIDDSPLVGLKDLMQMDKSQVLQLAHESVVSRADIQELRNDGQRVVDQWGGTKQELRSSRPSLPAQPKTSMVFKGKTQLCSRLLFYPHYSSVGFEL